MSPRVQVLLLAVGFAVATWLVGWWGIAAVAGAWGVRGQARWAALAALLAWAALLAARGVRGPVPMLADRLGGLIGVSGGIVLAATPLFAALLAWSAATVVAAATGRWKGARS